MTHDDGFGWLLQGGFKHALCKFKAMAVEIHDMDKWRGNPLSCSRHQQVVSMCNGLGAACFPHPRKYPHPRVHRLPFPWFSAAATTGL